jgi:cytochrome c oxidase subunit 2
VAAAALLPACSGAQHVLDPAGRQASLISDFWWFSLALSSVVFLLVVAGLLYAVFHRRRGVGPDHDPEKQRQMTRWVVGATAATVLVLLVYLIADLSTSRRIGDLAIQPTMTIEITGHQWWWEVHYADPVANRRLTTANEIHIPVGRPVRLKLESRDVIHSFWVPNLHGKKDLIPGYVSTTWLQADEPGVYSGQCAEFCGLQHAHMGLLVIAQPPEQFAAWYERQLEPAAPPTDSLRLRGQEVFLSRSCNLCHTIRGTQANARVAPDLTHLASRRTLAARTLPNTRGHLAGWIVDPQSIKPGNRMPPNLLNSDELEALLAYLESLR